MIPTTTMREALSDKKLLGKVLAGPSWAAWRTLMIAAMGERSEKCYDGAPRDPARTASTTAPAATTTSPIA
jgi:hypothetical protein